jgi:primary-amine oxidase
MPVDTTGFRLKPVGFFDRNPTLDVPATTGTSCHGRAAGTGTGGGCHE